MSTRLRNHRFGLVGTLAAAVLSLGALAVPLTPAKAQCLGVDLGLVCAGLGVPSAFSHPNPYYTSYPYAGYSYTGYPYTGYPYTSYPYAASPAYAHPYPYYNAYYPYPTPETPITPNP